MHGRRGVGVEGDLYDDEDLLNDCENDEMAGAADSLSKCVGKATFPLPAGKGILAESISLLSLLILNRSVSCVRWTPFLSG